MSSSTQRPASTVAFPSRLTASSVVLPTPTPARVPTSLAPATTAQVSRLVPVITSAVSSVTSALPVSSTALARSSASTSSGVLPSSIAATAPKAKGISTTTLIAIIVPAVLVICAIIGYCAFRRHKNKSKRYSDLHSHPISAHNYSTEKLVHSPRSLQSPRPTANPGTDWGNSPTFSAPSTYPPPLASPALYVSPPDDGDRGAAAGMVGEKERKDVKIVKRSFEPTLPDELVIHPGDRVQVITRFSDGWSLGINLDAADQGIIFKGVFPYDCLEDTPTYRPTPPPSNPSAQNPASFGNQQSTPQNPLYNPNHLPPPIGLPSPAPSSKSTTSGNGGYFPSPSPNGTFHPSPQQHSPNAARSQGPSFRANGAGAGSNERMRGDGGSPQIDLFARESSPFMTIEEEDERYGTRSNGSSGLGITAPLRIDGRNGQGHDLSMRANGTGTGRVGGGQTRTSSLIRKNGNGNREKEMLDALSGV